MKQVIYKVHIKKKKKVVTVPVGLRLSLRRVCVAVLRGEGFNCSAEVSITFADDSYMHELNKKYRGKDSPADMLSFPSILENGEYEVNDETGAKILGDIVLSIERAKRESDEEHSSMKGKLLFWTAHSLLHLLGYDHEKNRRDGIIMRDRAEVALSSVGYPHWNCRF